MDKQEMLCKTKYIPARHIELCSSNTHATLAPLPGLSAIMIDPRG